MLTQLRTGGVTPVWAERPDGPAHVVLVEHQADGGLVMAETQPSPGGQQIVALPLLLADADRLPAVLRGPVRLVTDGEGRLLQLEPVPESDPRTMRVATVVSDPFEPGAGNAAALLHPSVGKPGLSILKRWMVPRAPRTVFGRGVGLSDAVAAARADVQTVFLRRRDLALDLGPLNAVLASRGLRVIRIVPTAGLVLDPAELATLRQQLASSGRMAFVASAVSAIRICRHDFVVDAPGEWTRLDDGATDPGYHTTRTGRLARDLTRPDLEPTRGELVTWAAELATVPGVVVDAAGGFRTVIRVAVPLRPGPGSIPRGPGSRHWPTGTVHSGRAWRGQRLAAPTGRRRWRTRFAPVGWIGLGSGCRGDRGPGPAWCGGRG